MSERIFIEAVAPVVDNGIYPAKFIVGDVVHITADILCHNHDLLQARVRWRNGSSPSIQWNTVGMKSDGNDAREAQIQLERCMVVFFCIDAWIDTCASTTTELNSAANYSQLHYTAHTKAIPNGAPGTDKVEYIFICPDIACSATINEQHRWLPTGDICTSAEFQIVVDRPLACYSTWYTMFPRSQGSVLGQASTLREAAERLPSLRAMGFDVLYLTPIHPIGYTYRKGRNNSLIAGLGEPGCPWAIGNASGGHMDVDPGLGTISDFDQFVMRAAQEKMEVALDFAIQCSPDHPWIKQHPEWFKKNSDGTIKCAENPPKVYEDIYPLDFENPDKQALWNALLDILLFWIGHKVTIFRVDNPHTKPFAFWRWLITEVKRKHPQVIFLSEAFTTPKAMLLLCKLGFTQTYTYFTWLNDAHQLQKYVEENTTPNISLYFRPNYFPSTPDILPSILQTGGRAAFCIRLILAATLSSNYGIYSGFELCENNGLPGREEYLNSEKYEIHVRDWKKSDDNIIDLITDVNNIRAANIALQRTNNIRFCASNNHHILSYGKRHNNNVILVIVNLDPYNPHHASISVPLDIVNKQEYNVIDLLNGARYTWGATNYVRLDPQQDQVAHIFRVFMN